MLLKATGSDGGKSMRGAEGLVADMLCPTAAAEPKAKWWELYSVSGRTQS